MFADASLNSWAVWASAIPLEVPSLLTPADAIQLFSTALLMVAHLGSQAALCPSIAAWSQLNGAALERVAPIMMARFFSQNVRANHRRLLQC
jgi:hypothetical protein